MKTRTHPKVRKQIDQPNGHGFLSAFTVIVLLSLALLGVIYSTSSYFQIESLNGKVSSLESNNMTKEVLVFGDSITEGKPGYAGGWVGLLRQHFDRLRATAQKNYNEPIVYNMGISGNTTTDILKRIEPETKEKTYSRNLPIIIIQIGTNDSVQVSEKKYKDNLRKIIKKSRPISSRIIFVGLAACGDELCSSVFYSRKDRSNESLKRFENEMKAVAFEEKIDFIPLFDDFKKGLDDGDKLLADGLHPNKEGYTKIYDIISKKLIPLLTK